VVRRLDELRQSSLDALGVEWPGRRDQFASGIHLPPDVPQQHALYIAIPAGEASLAPLS